MRHAVLTELSRCVPGPALQRLHWSLAAAKVLRMKRAFRSPRKLMLSLLGALLACLWLGNALFAVMYRDPFSREALQSGFSGALLGYALWHVFKVSFQRPEDAIEWTPPEQILVAGGPFPRGQLVGYRLTGVMTAAALKTAAFLLFFWPDLHLPAAAACGAFASLVLLDLWRMTLEIATFQMSDAWYQRFRGGVYTLAGVALLFALARSICEPGAIEALSTPGGLRWVWNLARSINDLRHTPLGEVVQFPFWIFGQAVTAARWEPYTYAVLLAIGVYIPSYAALLVRWDAMWSARRQRRELREFLESSRQQRSPRGIACRTLAFPKAPRGAAALAWRQVVGARQQSWGLAAAMTVPVVLSLTPMYVTDHARMAAINVIAAAAFYSFLLLPALLKFDFRRDLDRMLVLKGLPLKDWQIVAAQITAPVLIALMFQMSVLALAILLRGLPISLLVVGAVLFVPLNLFMFASENATFLLYPYRLNEEGIEIFLRTTLVFTAKGLFCGIAAGLALVWFVTCVQLSKTWPQLSPTVMFMAGSWIMLVTSAAAAFSVLVSAYRRFDPSEDIPA